MEDTTDAENALGDGNGKEFENEVANVVRAIPHPGCLVGPQSVRGMSGNYWTVDIVARRSNIRLETPEIVLIECKDITSQLSSTYRNQLMRAYAELGDLRHIMCAKYVVISNKWADTPFNYDAYFESIGVKLMGWNKDKDDFIENLRKIFNTVGLGISP